MNEHELPPVAVLYETTPAHLTHLSRHEFHYWFEVKEPSERTGAMYDVAWWGVN